MDLGDTYVEKANRCQMMAGSAKTEEEKAAWLKLADSWLCLVRWRGNRGETYEETFAAQLQEAYIGQLDSTASH